MYATVPTQNGIWGIHNRWLLPQGACHNQYDYYDKVNLFNSVKYTSKFISRPIYSSMMCTSGKRAREPSGAVWGHMPHAIWQGKFILFYKVRQFFTLNTLLDPFLQAWCAQAESEQGNRLLEVKLLAEFEPNSQHSMRDMKPQPNQMKMFSVSLSLHGNPFFFFDISFPPYRSATQELDFNLL